MTAIAERGKWADLVKVLEEEVKENQTKPKGEKKTNKQLFEDFAEKHGTTYSSTSFYYYNEVKQLLNGGDKKTVEKKKDNQTVDKPIEKKIDVDRSIDDYTHKNVTDLSHPKDFYHAGDVIEVEVKGIVDYGVFCKTKEGFEGLVHISRITNAYVTLPEDYFYVGEKLRAKIVRVGLDGKIELSTKDIGGKAKINPVFKELAQKKKEAEIKPDTLKSETPKPEISKPTMPVTKESEKPRKAEVKVVKQDIEEPFVAPVPTHSSNDRDNIIDFIKRYSDNVVSKDALVDIDNLIGEHGVFNTTMALMEIVRDLDVSSFITNLAKEKLNGEYLRRS